MFEKPKFKLLKQHIDDINDHKIEDILKKAVKKEKDKKLAEFYYKLYTDNITSASVLCKWVEGIPEKCIICNETDDTTHMLFTCPIVESIWDISGETLEETFSIGKFLSLEYDIEKTKVLKYMLVEG